MYVYEAHARVGDWSRDCCFDDGITVPSIVCNAIDEKRCWFPVSHVLFKSGFLQNARAITERAHEVGAMLCLTLTNQPVRPLQCKDLTLDFATGGRSVALWCPGAGYLYVVGSSTDASTKDYRLMAHEAPFSFETDSVTAPDIRRFLHGARLRFHALCRAVGYRIINEIGVINPRKEVCDKRRNDRAS